MSDTVYLINTYCDIAEVHRLQGNYIKAIEYSENALTLSNLINNKYMGARVLTSFASTYIKMEELEKALENNLKALSIYEFVGVPFYIGTTSVEIGNRYLNLNDYKKARHFLKKSYDIFKKSDIEGSMILSLLGLGKLYIGKGRFRFSFLEAERLSNKLRLIPSIKRSYEELAVLYSKRNNFNKSNYYLNKFIYLG